MSTGIDKNILPARLQAMISRKQIVELWGSQSELARVAGLTRATVNTWSKSDKPVPAEYVGKICKAAPTKGVILTPVMMRPDLWPAPST
jgi:DNA-binding transcriptional regulator YdaS (Cro superfamily)